MWLFLHTHAEIFVITFLSVVPSAYTLTLFDATWVPHSTVNQVSSRQRWDCLTLWRSNFFLSLSFAPETTHLHVWLTDFKAQGSATY